MTLYWVTSATGASPTAQFDAFELTLATGRAEVCRVMMWQTTDLGDAAEEVLLCQFIRGNATSGSGGQTTVLTPNNSYDVAATAAAELLNTTPGSTGSPVALAQIGWNIRIPLDIIFPPGYGPIVRTTERLCLRVQAPADAITVNCAFCYDQQ